METIRAAQEEKAVRIPLQKIPREVRWVSEDCLTNRRNFLRAAGGILCAGVGGSNLWAMAEQKKESQQKKLDQRILQSIEFDEKKKLKHLVVSHGGDTRTISEFSDEGYTKSILEYYKLPYLNNSFIQLGVGKKQFYIYPSEDAAGGSIIATNGKIALARFRYKDKTKPGKHGITFCYVDLRTGKPVIKEYELGSQNYQFDYFRAGSPKNPTLRKTGGRENLEFLKLVADEKSGLAELLLTKSKLSPDIAKNLRPYDGQFVQAQPYWKRLIENNRLHIHHITSARAFSAGRYKEVKRMPRPDSLNSTR